MNTTPVSLLERLRRPDEQEAWKQFVALYTPLMWHWAHKLGMPAQDMADFVQDVLLLLVRKIPDFRYTQEGRFRGWLWTVLVNKYRERRRGVLIGRQVGEEHIQAAQVPDPIPEIDEAEYRQHLVRRALQLMQAEFQPTTWRACWESVVSGKSAEEVAGELGMSPGAVRVAKFRVLSRLRVELKGLLE